MWVADEHQCVASNVDGVKLTLIVTLITDILLLVTVLVGLFHLRRDGGGRFGLQGVLWRQVWWMAIPFGLSSSMYFHL